MSLLLLSKHKTSDEMRISDWSSYVCSSDLQIDTTTPSGRMVFGIFATLAEFERDMIRERTMAGLAAARARGRKGGRKFALSKAQVRLAQAAMAQRDTSVSDLCKELGIERVTLRSEEHPSELQSLMRISYAVFCLKNKHKYN